MNVIKEIKREFGICAVSKENGDLEIYYSGDLQVRSRIILWLSMKSLLNCFVNLKLITV